MRLRIFIIHFVVITAVVIVMAISGYFGLRNAVFRQEENRLKSSVTAWIMESKSALESTYERDFTQALVNRMEAYKFSGRGYAWAVDEQGNFLFYPSGVDGMDDSRDYDKNHVFPRLSKSAPVFFHISKDDSRRFVYGEYVPFIRGYLVLSDSASQAYEILEGYSRFIIFCSAAVIFLSLITSIPLSIKLMKPLAKLHEFANKLAVGELIDKHEALNDPDIAPIAKVLEKFYAQTHKDETMDQNPLSGLPGNKSLYDALYKRIESAKDFAVGYIDGNNFAAYNNKYGFEKGDSVIRFMGTVTLNAIKEKGNKEDNVFHLGADRYFFITTTDKVKEICEKIIRDYDTQIVYYYDEEARDRGFIVSKDNKGNVGEFSFMPICIGVATTLKRPLLHPLQIGHIAGEIRNFLRGRQKSDYLLDRRITDRIEEHKGEMAPFTKDELEQVKKEIEQMQKIEEAVIAEGQPVRELTAEIQLDTESSPDESSEGRQNK